MELIFALRSAHNLTAHGTNKDATRVKSSEETRNEKRGHGLLSTADDKTKKRK